MAVMLKRVNKSLFSEVFRAGLRLRSKFFNLCFKENLEGNVLRCSVVVSKKILSTATKRNLLKRRVRQIAKEIVSHRNDFSGKTILFFARPEAKEAKFEDFRSDINAVLLKIFQKSNN